MAPPEGHLWERSRATARHDEPRPAVASAMRRTVELWNAHGTVMRTAIDLSSTVPEIGELWSRTADSQESPEKLPEAAATCEHIRLISAGPSD